MPYTDALAANHPNTGGPEFPSNRGFRPFCAQLQKSALIHLFSDIYRIIKARIWQRGVLRSSERLPRQAAAARNPDGIDFVGNFKISSFPQIRPRPRNCGINIPLRRRRRAAFWHAASTRGWPVCAATARVGPGWGKEEQAAANGKAFEMLA
jgi:hypothetical protein